MGLQCSLFPIRGDVHSFLVELRGACLLLALSGHGLVRCTCPLSGVKRTCHFALQMSAYDPERTCSDCGPMFAFGVKADINSGTTPALGSYEGGGYERQDEGR